MIWLASYPRSGNTFFRNVLFEAYGIRSSTFHDEAQQPLDADYADYPVVKTHLLPDQLVPADPSIPAVYLIRDGRDCVVSLAHYRQQLVAPESDFRLNLREAIDAAGGSQFGGWSRHVRHWSRRACLILRFEELINDPIACLERLRPWIDLPQPDVSKVPTFNELRTQDFRYGSGAEHGFSDQQRRRWRTGKFRRGVSGGWRDELPHDLHLRFLHFHGVELQQAGYLDSMSDDRDPSAILPSPSSPPLAPATPQQQPQAIQRNELGDRSGGESTKRSYDRPPRVLIDGSKLLDPRIDGINRYVRELLIALDRLISDEQPDWDIDVSLGHLGIAPLSTVVGDLNADGSPLGVIHPLWRQDLGNPINRTLAKIERCQQAGHRGVSLYRLRLRYHRLHRSLIKRVLKVKQALSGNNRPYDLMHLTLPNTWQHFQHLDHPLLTTVHDLSHLVCPDLQTTANVETLQQGLEFSESRNASYLAVSHATKADLVDRLAIAAKRIRVAHNAVSTRRFFPEADGPRTERIRQKYAIDDAPFLLCLGTIEPRKNLINTVKAFIQLLDDHPDPSIRLILAGGTGWQHVGELQQLIDAEPRVQAIGYVDDEDLPLLYSAAEALCYVSRYEGYGLPILEAMACGTAVIYGNNSAMPELAEGCGLPADADDPRTIRDAMRRLLSDPEQQRNRQIASVMRAKRFTWEQSARQTLAAYRDLISGQRAARREYRSLTTLADRGQADGSLRDAA